MYDDVVKVIEAGGYDLADLLLRIDKLHLLGRLDDAQRDGLADMAREKSTPVVEDEGKSIVALTVRVQALEGRVDALEGKAAEEWPEYEEGRIYRQGDGVTFSGKRYRMVLPGETAASPAVYPDAWELVGEAPAGGTEGAE